MSAWQGFQLVPDDVLFFRDGKPSTQGQDHALRSLFPPHPFTLYGALRTHRLTAIGVSLAGLDAATWAERLGPLVAELGAWGGFGSLAVRGPWLVRGGAEVLLPAPHDLAVTEEPGKNREEEAGSPRVKEELIAPRVKEVGRFRPPEESAAGEWSHPLAALRPCRQVGGEWQVWNPAAEEADPTPASGWYLTPEGFAAWAAGGVPLPEHFVHQGSLWRREPRTGVGLEDGRRSSKKSHLYTFDFIRLEAGVALGFEISGGELAAGGLVRLGGEGRTATLERGPSLPALPPPLAGARRLALCFATPALSAAGSLPPGFDAQTHQGTLGGVPTKLVAAVVQAPLQVGGWDVAQRRPKPLRNAIPPGSVYLVEPLAGTAQDLAHRVSGSSLSADGTDHLTQQGFGLALGGASL